jgi:hypothetical protein
VRGETLGIYLENEGEGEIRRGTDLSEVGEENPQRILKNCRREALVIRSCPWVAGEELEEKKRRRGRRWCGRPFIGLEFEHRIYSRSNISDQSDIFSLNRIYPVQSDLAEILQKTEIDRMYPS